MHCSECRGSAASKFQGYGASRNGESLQLNRKPKVLRGPSPVKPHCRFKLRTGQRPRSSITRQKRAAGPRNSPTCCIKAQKTHLRPRPCSPATLKSRRLQKKQMRPEAACYIACKFKALDFMITARRCPTNPEHPHPCLLSPGHLHMDRDLVFMLV